ncbi:hypothetical protein Fmac_024544 [Flemingia macrophylla]|uniref:Uncharacterized protein n=1 Tax=Flemingia macrophylla TaxID=520843 RepID=A0ABD1LPN8_9FABA
MKPPNNQFFKEMLHQSQFNNLIYNLVFINNLDWSLLNRNNVERFKRLYRMELLHVERVVARLQLTTCFDVTSAVSIVNVSDDDDNQETETTSLMHGVSLIGNVAISQVGPIVGLVEECEDAYTFCVALLGVKRDESFLLEDTFYIDGANLEHTNEVILDTVTRLYQSHRCRLHQHFKQFEAIEMALEYKPQDLSTKDWEYLVHYFFSSKFKRDPETQKEPNFLFLWKITHTNNNEEWVDEKSRELHMKVQEVVLEKL